MHYLSFQSDGCGVGPPEVSEVLPYDVLVYALGCLESPFDLAAAQRVSKSFRSAGGEEAVWKSLVNQRYGLCDTQLRDCADARSEFADARSEFADKWHSAQDFIRSITYLGAEVSPPSLCSALSSTLVQGLPVCCSAPTPSKEAEGVCEDDLKRGIGLVAEALACGHVSVADLVDWLLTDAAARQPVRCLALLALLQPYTAAAAVASGAKAAPQWASDRSRWVAAQPALAEAKAAAVCRLGTASPPPPALRQRVVVKWHTWSTARDCRGFRARDDMHRATADLATLCREPRHVAWNVLARGVVNEVRSIRVNVAE